MREYLTSSHYLTFVPGSPHLSLDYYTCEESLATSSPEWSFKFRAFKYAFDYGCALIALPLIAIIACTLLLLNPFLNPGPLFFVQTRAGKDREEFRMWKFRTMVPSKVETRGHDQGLEEDRITKLGRILRKTRIDELPNFFNVLRGEMSVIGPRPEAASHAQHFSSTVFGYANRLRVKPGITGLAQIEQGYVDDMDAVQFKAKYDNIYVSRSCGRLDLYIIFKTFMVMLKGIGAR